MCSDLSDTLRSDVLSNIGISGNGRSRVRLEGNNRSISTIRLCGNLGGREWRRHSTKSRGLTIS